MSSANDKIVSSEKSKDIRKNWVGTSRFMFYLSLVAYVALFLGMSYGLWTKRYKGHPDVEVPTNTLFHPTYK